MHHRFFSFRPDDDEALKIYFASLCPSSFLPPPLVSSRSPNTSISLLRFWPSSPLLSSFSPVYYFENICFWREVPLAFLLLLLFFPFLGEDLFATYAFLSSSPRGQQGFALLFWGFFHSPPLIPPHRYQPFFPALLNLRFLSPPFRHVFMTQHSVSAFISEGPLCLASGLSERWIRRAHKFSLGQGRSVFFFPLIAW